MKLTRREAILLVLLLIFAVIFAEYHLVVTPGIERYLELESRKAELDDQINTINLDLLVAEQKKEQIDQHFQEINVYHDRFLGELNPSVLLHYTYDLMSRNDFTPSEYTISPITQAMPYAEGYTEQGVTYALAELVTKYNMLQGIYDDTDPATEGADSTDSEQEVEPNIASIELNEFLVSGSGSYEQIKSLLDDIKRQEKSIVVSIFDMNAAEDNMIDFNMNIQYYGVKKFDVEFNEFNTWPRQSFISGFESPFASITTEEEAEDNDVMPSPEEQEDPEETDEQGDPDEDE